MSDWQVIRRHPGDDTWTPTDFGLDTLEEAIAAMITRAYETSMAWQVELLLTAILKKEIDPTVPHMLDETIEGPSCWWCVVREDSEPPDLPDQLWPMVTTTAPVKEQP